MKILVVDDNRDFCDSLSDVLVLGGHNAVCRYDAENTIPFVKNDPPDVVLLDMVMPGVDGLETFRRLKLLAPELPVIMMSGFSTEDRSGAAVQEGLYAFMRKPIDFPQLFDLLKRIDKKTPPAGT